MSGLEAMQQQISVITLGVADIGRTRRFYADGFGWEPVFANDEILFYQMNGLVLGMWLAEALARDAGRLAAPSGGFALAHNVARAAAVDELVERLTGAGATLLRSPDAPPHGGYRGHIADPDGHAWELAYNPAWTIDADGHVISWLERCVATIRANPKPPLPCGHPGIRATSDIFIRHSVEGISMSDTAERVKKIVVEHLGVEADKVTEDASFIDDLGADSLDIVELVMAFEEEFGVEIPDDAAEKISTVSDAIKYIDEHKG